MSYRGRGGTLTNARGGPRGGQKRGSPRGGARGGGFSSLPGGSYDSPTSSTSGPSLDWASSQARAKMLNLGGYDYYEDFGDAATAPPPADYHSAHSELVSYPVRGAKTAPASYTPSANAPEYGGAKPRGGGHASGKRPPVPSTQPSPNGGAAGKRTKLSSMNELLESSQRDMSQLSSQGVSGLNQILEKQQKLLEMQSKMIAEMAHGGGIDSLVPEAEREADFMEVDNSQAAAGPSRGGGRGRPPRSRGRLERRAPRKKTSLWDTLEPQGKPDPYARIPAGRGRDPYGYGREDLYRETEDDYEYAAAGRGTRGRGGVSVAGARGRGVSLGRMRGRGTDVYGRGRGAPISRGRAGVIQRNTFKTPYPVSADPYGADPYDDPYADPYADPYGMDPYAADPYDEDPYVEDPYYTDPYAEDPYTLDPYAPAPVPTARPKPAAMDGQDIVALNASSVETRLNILVRRLMGYELLSRPISAIESTRHELAQEMKIRTEYITFKAESKSPPVFGILKINGVVLSLVQEDVDRDMKLKTYQQGLYTLLTMSVSEMFRNSSKLVSLVPNDKQEIYNLKSAPNRVVSSRLKYIIDQVQEELHDNARRGIVPKVIHEVDVACGNADAGITLVYYHYPGDSMITCEFYLDDLNLATAKAYKNQTAYHFVYNDVKRYLMDPSLYPEDIVFKNKRLTSVDLYSDEVKDFQFKGRNHERGNNLWILKSKYPNTWKEDINNRREPVILMKSLDKPGLFFRTLEDLAGVNHMLLQYVIYGEDQSGHFRSVMFLQGELVGSGEGTSKADAKYNAAREALATLKENNPVIQVAGRKYKNVDYTFETVKQQAREMQAEDPYMFQNWNQNGYPKPHPDDPEIDELTPYIDKVLEDILNEYIHQPGLEEIILDRDFPTYHITFLIRKSQNLDVDVEKKEGDENQDRRGRTVVQKGVFSRGYPIDLVKILLDSGGQSGRYSLFQWLDESGHLVQKRS